MKALAYFMAASLPGFLLSAQAPTGHREPQPYDIQLSSKVAEKLLIHMVDPKCLGGPARVTGTVVLDINISIEGDVLHPVVISGPSLLRQPALDAVRQYKYRPYQLKGRPVQVETTVSVPFTLNDRC